MPARGHGNFPSLWYGRFRQPAQLKSASLFGSQSYLVRRSNHVIRCHRLRETARLFFDGLNLGDGGFDRLERLFGEVGIEFARFRHIPNEPFEKRLGIFRLNLNGALD
jgi:hypothetical protein